jgi:signal transduction histidine kinase/ActR/RegA family two-component response regulator
LTTQIHMSLKELLSYPIQLIAKKWQDFPLAIKGVLVISLPLSILLFSFVNLYFEEQKSVSLENRLREILTNQQNIKEMHAQLLEASTAVRDYLLTGDKDFLKVYKVADEKIPLILAVLKQHIQDAEVKRRCDDLTPLILENLASLKDISQSSVDKSSESLVDKFKTQTDTLNKLRIEIEKIDNRESLLIKNNLELVNQQRQRYINLSLSLAFISILGSLFAAWFFSQTIVNRIRILRDNAIKLAHGEPVSLAKNSMDEIGQLSEELDHASQLLSKSVKDANSAKVEALEASSEKSKFLSRTSHELRTPLNAILGFSYLLEQDLPQSKNRDSVSLIKGAAEHLLKLINEVLDIAKIESGDTSISLKSIDIYQLLNEAVEYIRPLGKIRDIDIKTDYKQGLFALADHQKLLQVVLNLLSNAFKYGPPNSTVTLSAYEKNKILFIEVLDLGKGISDELRNRVFTPFDRLGAENTKIEGTGLGLALSKQIINAMNGTIHIAKNKSLFWLELPASQAEKSIVNTNTIQQNKTIEATNKKHTIIYVEDNASNRALVEAIVGRQKGLRLYSANTIKQARELLTNIQPEILLIDLSLPDGSGEDLLVELRQKEAYSQLPIFILSADAMTETISRLMTKGASDYFTKPLNIALFNQKLKQIIEKENTL